MHLYVYLCRLFTVFVIFLQISEADKGKYQKGREWWDDTLFSFTPQIDQSSRVMEPCTLG